MTKNRKTLLSMQRVKTFCLLDSCLSTLMNWTVLILGSSTHRRQEPSVSFNSGSGTMIHPLTTNIPVSSHTSGGRSGLHGPSFPTHWAEPSVPDWNVQQNNSGPTVNPVTTYSPEAPYTGARRSDLHPSYRTQSASQSPETSNTQHAQVNKFIVE